MLNVFWLLSSFMVALEYLVFGVVLCCTIVGIPCGLQLLKLAKLMLWPFGTKVTRPSGADSSASASFCSCLSHAGFCSCICNILWLPFGVILAITHVVFAFFSFLGAILQILTCVGCCFPLIGIPFAVQHVKFAGLAFCPFGTKIVFARKVACWGC